MPGDMWLARASGQLTRNTLTETRRIVHRVLLPRLRAVPLAGLERVGSGSGPYLSERSLAL
jgi:hypothetical protein